jgi:hypothetical protein
MRHRKFSICYKALHFSIPSCTYLSNCMILILALNSVRKLSNFGFPKASQCWCSLAAEIAPPRVHDRVSFGSNPVSGRTAQVGVMPAMNMAQLQHINPLGITLQKLQWLPFMVAAKRTRRGSRNTLMVGSLSLSAARTRVGDG